PRPEGDGLTAMGDRLAVVGRVEGHHHRAVFGRGAQHGDVQVVGADVAQPPGELQVVVAQVGQPDLGGEPGDHRTGRHVRVVGVGGGDVQGHGRQFEDEPVEAAATGVGAVPDV